MVAHEIRVDQDVVAEVDDEGLRALAVALWHGEVGLGVGAQHGLLIEDALAFVDNIGPRGRTGVVLALFECEYFLLVLPQDGLILGCKGNLEKVLLFEGPGHDLQNDVSHRLENVGDQLEHCLNDQLLQTDLLFFGCG